MFQARHPVSNVERGHGAERRPLTRDLVRQEKGDDPTCRPSMETAPAELLQHTHKQSNLLVETEPFSRGAFSPWSRSQPDNFPRNLCSEMMEEQRGGLWVSAGEDHRKLFILSFL